MKVRFLGPLNQVTGSCCWLKDESLGVSFLVDCGDVQGEGRPAYCEKFPFDPRTIDFVLLTHAHLDHVGLLPKLACEGFDGPIFCTEETERLTLCTLHDCDEIDPSTLRFRRLGDGLLRRAHEVAPGVNVTAYRAGHILGAVSFRVNWKGPNGNGGVIFSGDLGSTREARNFSFIKYPDRPRQANYLVMESTYGSKNHSDGPWHITGLMGQLDELVDIVRERRGVLLIPAFSIERTQAIQFILHELYRTDKTLADVPLYVDSPGGMRAGKVYAEALRGGPDGSRSQWLANDAMFQLGLDPENAEHRAAFDHYITEIFDPEEGEVGGSFPELINKILPGARRIQRIVDDVPKRVLRKGGGPAIILVSGGMLCGGTVLKYLNRLLRLPTTVVALTGYVARDTIGRRLEEIEEASANGMPLGTALLKWTGGPQKGIKPSEVLATTRRLHGYSGHADQRGLVSWAKDGRLATDRIFLVHGSASARWKLMNALRFSGPRRGPWIDLPRDAEAWFDLDLNQWEDGKSFSDPDANRPSELLARGEQDFGLVATAAQQEGNNKLQARKK